jgi:hypothetical protein
LNNNKSIWNHDYKGVNTKNYIIDPLLKYIKVQIDEYWINNIDNFKDADIKKLKELQLTFLKKHFHVQLLLFSLV